MQDDRKERLLLAAMRITMGWLLFYAGITKVLDPGWSAAGYLKGAKTFPGFYTWLASPDLLPFVNFMNEWGLTLLGIALMLGAFTRLSAALGSLLMILYWFPVLDFPYVDHGFLVDDHVVYAIVLAYLCVVRAGMRMGLDQKLAKLPLFERKAELAKRLM